MTLGNETITDNSSVFCTANYDNASSVIMWATFNGVMGKNSRLEPLKTTTTTTTITTTTIVTITNNGNVLHESS